MLSGSEKNPPIRKSLIGALEGSSHNHCNVRISIDFCGMSSERSSIVTTSNQGSQRHDYKIVIVENFAGDDLSHNS